MPIAYWPGGIWPAGYWPAGYWPWPAAGPALPTYLGLSFEPLGGVEGLDLDLSTFEDLDPDAAGPTAGLAVLDWGLVAGDFSGAEVTLDTRGADLIVLGLSQYDLGSVVPADSLGNSWTPLTERRDGGANARLWYCARPATGAAHTLSLTGAGSYPDLGYLVLAGSDSLPAGPESGATSEAAASISAGSLTPPRPGCLVVSVLSADSGSGYEASDPAPARAVDFLAGTRMGGGLSWEIQGAAAARNPTWSLPGVLRAAVAAAAFRPAPGGAATALPTYLGLTFEPLDSAAGIDLDMSTFEDV